MRNRRALFIVRPGSLAKDIYRIPWDDLGISAMSPRKSASPNLMLVFVITPKSSVVARRWIRRFGGVPYILITNSDDSFRDLEIGASRVFRIPYDSLDVVKCVCEKLDIENFDHV